MGLFNKKSGGASKGKNSCNEGYVSFTSDDLKNSAEQAPNNEEAYGYLDKAMAIAYPTTLEETLEMEKYLKLADEAVQDRNDNYYRSCADELRDIADWSKKRHWNFSWLLIVGVIVTVFLVNLWSEQKVKDLEEERAVLAKIESWEEQELTLEMAPEGMDSSYDRYKVQFNSANDYKSYWLAFHNNCYFDYIKSVEEERAKLDTASTREMKSIIKEAAERWQSEADEAKERFETMNAMNFKQLRKYAIEEQQEEIDEAAGDSRFAKFLFIFFIILIPVYIFADRPYGYTITRHREETELVGGIQKIGYILAGGLASMGAGIGFVDVITKWSDGSTTRSDDGTGPARLVLKAFLFFAAILVFCAVSCFVVVYTTIMGLIRNYDWKTIFAGARQKVESAKK